MDNVLTKEMVEKAVKSLEGGLSLPALKYRAENRLAVLEEARNGLMRFVVANRGNPDNVEMQADGENFLAQIEADIKAKQQIIQSINRRLLTAP